MTFKRSPFPMHQGTASHKSALRNVSPNKGLWDSVKGLFSKKEKPDYPDKEIELDKSKSETGLGGGNIGDVFSQQTMPVKQPKEYQEIEDRAVEIDQKKKLFDPDTGETIKQSSRPGDEFVTDEELNPQAKKKPKTGEKKRKAEKKAKRKERWKKRGEAFDKLGYVVDEAVNRQGKATQSFEVWKNRGKPGYQWDEDDPNSKTTQPWNFQETDDTKKEKSEKVEYKSKYSPEQIDKVIDAIMKGSEKSTEEIVEEEEGKENKE